MSTPNYRSTDAPSYARLVVDIANDRAVALEELLAAADGLHRCVEEFRPNELCAQRLLESARRYRDSRVAYNRLASRDAVIDRIARDGLAGFRRIETGRPE